MKRFIFSDALSNGAGISTVGFARSRRAACDTANVPSAADLLFNENKATPKVICKRSAAEGRQARLEKTAVRGTTVS